MSRSWSWTSACVRALTADSRVARDTRMDSITPVVAFGRAVASPARTLRAAASASIASSGVLADAGELNLNHEEW